MTVHNSSSWPHLQHSAAHPSVFRFHYRPALGTQERRWGLHGFRQGSCSESLINDCLDSDSYIGAKLPFRISPRRSWQIPYLGLIAAFLSQDGQLQTTFSDNCLEGSESLVPMLTILVCAGS